MSNNLTSGYHRDLQVYKGKIIQAINEIVNCLEIFNYSLKKIKVRRDILKDKKYEYIFSVENLNELVKSGKSFRDSYNQVSNEIKNDSFVPKKDIKHEIIGGINNLCLDEIELKMNKIFDL